MTVGAAFFEDLLRGAAASQGGRSRTCDGVPPVSVGKTEEGARRRDCGSRRASVASFPFRQAGGRSPRTTGDAFAVEHAFPAWIGLQCDVLTRTSKIDAFRCIEEMHSPRPTGRKLVLHSGPPSVSPQKIRRWDRRPVLQDHREKRATPRREETFGSASPEVPGRFWHAVCTLFPSLHEQGLARTCSKAHRNAFSDRLWERVLCFWKGEFALCSPVRPGFDGDPCRNRGTRSWRRRLLSSASGLLPPSLRSTWSSW